ncbi:hypothetical protein [Proteiniborus sp.]|uniref:hypothetical protein n=1 Tax=Proteiniborus sp. TaxID=2079015 RepID=UPI0033344125
MTTEKAFFILFFIITFLYSLRVQIGIFINRNKVKETQGTITYIESAMSPGLPHINAKLATFEYFVDGKIYTSKNSIKMPLSAEVGDVKVINYFIDNPSILYKINMNHFYIAATVSVICLLLAIFV